MIGLKSTTLAAALALASAFTCTTAAPSTPRTFSTSSEDLFARTNGAHSYTGPYTTGGAAWSNGFAKAKSLIDQMTVEEKVNVTTGYTASVSVSPAPHPDSGWKRCVFKTVPAGVRPARRVSQFPAGVTTAATWDRELIAQRAERWRKNSAIRASTSG